MSIVFESSSIYGRVDRIKERPFVYPDGTTTPSRPLADVEEYPHLDGIRWSFAALVVPLILFRAAWALRFCWKSTVKQSQPFFLLLICGSAFVVALFGHLKNCILSSRSCMIQPWLLSIGLTIPFAAIFSKTRRVYSSMLRVSDESRKNPRTCWVPFLGCPLPM